MFSSSKFSRRMAAASFLILIFEFLLLLFFLSDGVRLNARAVRLEIELSEVAGCHAAVGRHLQRPRNAPRKLTLNHASPDVFSFDTDPMMWCKGRPASVLIKQTTESIHALIEQGPTSSSTLPPPPYQRTSVARQAVQQLAQQDSRSVYCFRIFNGNGWEWVYFT